MGIKQNRSQAGYVLLGVVILLGLSSIVVMTTLKRSRVDLKTIRASKIRSQRYFDAEESLNNVVTWFRENSKSLATPFTRDNFYNNFDIVTPAGGANDSALYGVPTRLRINGTNKSPVLTNDASLATASFPVSSNISTGLAFDPDAQFSAAALGDASVRVTLVDAIPVTPADDHGDPDDGNPAPDTDFHPVYRIDSMSAIDEGAHVYGYIVGSLDYAAGFGFYGEDYVEVRQECDSFKSDDGAYAAATKRANCSIGSNGDMRIHGAEAVYGTAHTNGAFNNGAPFGGDVCADFDAGCPNPGDTCEGAACGVPALPTYDPWAVYCPADQGVHTVARAATDTLTVASDAPADKCWAKVELKTNATLKLTTTDHPYFFQELDIANNATVAFLPADPNGTIEIYVKKITGDKFNGNQVFNTANKPYQLKIHYLGLDDITMNGTAQINAFMVAPYANVTVSGTFDYHGGIKAKSLDFSGNGSLHYDESGDETALNDVTFEITKIGQHYR